MGRWPWSGRFMVEECSVISVYDPDTKEKILKRGEDPGLDIVVYRDGVEVLRHGLLVTKTQTRYGGWRYWLRCHMCYKRVAKVYLPPGGRLFGCRKCHNLTYRSQKQHDKTLDKYLKNPAMMRLLEARVKAGDITACGLVVRAAMRGLLD